VVAGVGVERIVTAASKHALAGTESLILASAVTTVMAAMTAIGWTSAARRGNSASTLPLTVLNVALTAATCAVGLTGRFTVPVLLIATLAVLCALQLALSLRVRSLAGA